MSASATSPAAPTARPGPWTAQRSATTLSTSSAFRLWTTTRSSGWKERTFSTRARPTPRVEPVTIHTRPPLGGGVPAAAAAAKARRRRRTWTADLAMRPSGANLEEIGAISDDEAEKTVSLSGRAERRVEKRGIKSEEEGVEPLRAVGAAAGVEAKRPRAMRVSTRAGELHAVIVVTMALQLKPDSCSFSTPAPFLDVPAADALKSTFTTPLRSHHYRPIHDNVA